MSTNPQPLSPNSQHHDSAVPSPHGAARMAVVQQSPVTKHSFGSEESAHARLPRDGTFVLPVGVCIVGKLDSAAPLLIEGQFSGHVRCTNSVVIAEAAHIIGSLDVEGDLVIAGRVEGDGNNPTTIVCRGKLELAATANISGEEVQYATIGIYEGARISATLRGVQG